MATWTTENYDISYEEEMVDAIGFSRGRERSTAFRIVEVAGQYVELFCKDMLGYTELLGTGRLKRRLPNAHPRFPRLYATNVEFVEPISTASDAAPQQHPTISKASTWFTLQKLRVNYETLPFDPRKDEDVLSGSTYLEYLRYVTRREAFSIEGIRVPLSSFVYEGTTVDIPEPPTLSVPTGTLTMMWYEIPAEESSGAWVLPSGLATNIDSVVGKINNAAFLGYPAKTLYCLPPEYTEIMQGNLYRAFNIQYSFTIRGRVDNSGITANHPSQTPDWDRIFRVDGPYPAEGPWYRVTRKDDATKSIYDTADFTKLFKFT